MLCECCECVCFVNRCLSALSFAERGSTCSRLLSRFCPCFSSSSLFGLWCWARGRRLGSINTPRTSFLSHLTHLFSFFLPKSARQHGMICCLLSVSQNGRTASLSSPLLRHSVIVHIHLAFNSITSSSS